MAKRLFEQGKRERDNITEQSLRARPQCLWKYVKDSTKDNVAPVTLQEGENFYSDPIDATNLFAKHFSYCFKTNDCPLQYSDTRCTYFLSFVPLNEIEVLEAIRKLKPKLSAGAD